MCLNVLLSLVLVPYDLLQCGSVAVLYVWYGMIPKGRERKGR